MPSGCPGGCWLPWPDPSAACCAPPAGAYGSTKRYKSFERLRKVNDACVVGASGELSDFQYIMRCAGWLLPACA